MYAVAIVQGPHLYGNHSPTKSNVPIFPFLLFLGNIAAQDQSMMQAVGENLDTACTSELDIQLIA
jgi:hypothetical protein